MKQIRLNIGEHRNNRVVFIIFDINSELISTVKNFGALWSATKRSWYILENQFILNDFMKLMKGIALVDYSGLQEIPKQKGTLIFAQNNSEKKKANEVHQFHLDILIKYREKLLIKRYSDSTIRTYCSLFGRFLNWAHNINPVILTEDDVNKFILQNIKDANLSTTLQNQYINAIRFFYNKVENKPKHLMNPERPKRERKLPEVMSMEEIQQLINVTENLKHKCILSLIYGSGLRISEAVSMKLSDIEIDRHMLKIRSGKGKKDRYSIVSEKFIL